MTKRDPEETHRARAALAYALVADPARQGPHGQACEGQAYMRHECAGSVQMNEVLYPRHVFQNMPHEKQMAFWSKFNCSLNCELFHKTCGHSTAFRWWFRQRMERVYGVTDMRAWEANLPLKENAK